MDAPTWWSEQRFGLVVQNSIAAVPAWAPIGRDADRYRQYLGEDDSDGLVEVLAHHRDRWGHVDRFDDFVDLLTFEHFDAYEWAALAVEAGMTHVEVQARDHDGWCWWDAPGTDRTTVVFPIFDRHHTLRLDVIRSWLRPLQSIASLPHAAFISINLSALVSSLRVLDQLSVHRLPRARFSSPRPPVKHQAPLLLQTTHIMAAPEGPRQYVPLTCHGHSRPVPHISFSSLGHDDNYFMVSACKGEAWSLTKLA